MCDTFDNVPDHLCSAVIIDELIFTRLREYVGPVFTGLASPAWNSAGSSEDWGRAIALNSQDTLQMRIYPRGLLSAGRLADMPTEIVLLAARRRTAGVCKESVSIAVLWHPEGNTDCPGRPFNPLKETCQPVATRNLHIVAPSLFNHHDAQYGSKSGTRRPKWPVLDPANFHAVRPGSFTIHRPIKLPGGQQVVTATASPGVSQFIIAGQLAGVDVDDPPHRASEPLSYAGWSAMVDKYSDVLIESRGSELATMAMLNSLSVTDLLTCEGMLGILGHQFVSGAMPDMMHSPGGFPLLISFAVRLACYPKRYQLVGGSDADLLANREIISLFEGGWEPVSKEEAGGRNMYVIDLAMQKAYADARETAKRLDTLQAVDDNMVFWYRAGQRCLTAIFGPQVEDFSPVQARFGTCERVVDPLIEARNRVIQNQMSPRDAAQKVDGRSSLSMATPQVKRSVLLTMMNSVEHWLRTGEYAGMQLHAQNTSVSMRIKRSNRKNRMTKASLREALMQGAEDSVAELVASGEAKTVEEARQKATTMSEGIYAAVEASENEIVDFNDLNLNIPAELANTLGLAIAERKNDKQAAKHDTAIICGEAFKSGVNGISSSMCQGPLVHHEFNMSIYLSSPCAVSQCADCDAGVHLLTATFFAPRTGCCATCGCARCGNCAAEAHQKRINGIEPPDHCKRCVPQETPRPLSPEAPTSPLADPPRKATGKGSRKKKQPSR